MSLSASDRQFIRIVKLASAACLGGMAGFIYSLKSVHPSIRMEFSVGTLLVSLAFGAFTWVFFTILFREEDRACAADSGSIVVTRRRLLVRWLVGFSIFFGLGTLYGFVRSLEGVGSEKIREVAEGALGALFFLTIVGFGWWKVVQYFEEQSQAELDRIEEARKLEENEPGDET